MFRNYGQKIYWFRNYFPSGNGFWKFLANIISDKKNGTHSTTPLFLEILRRNFPGPKNRKWLQSHLLCVEFGLCRKCNLIQLVLNILSDLPLCSFFPENNSVFEKIFTYKNSIIFNLKCFLQFSFDCRISFFLGCGKTQ